MSVHKLLFVVAAAVAIANLRAQQPIASITVKPVACKYPDCIAHLKHGDVMATQSDGKQVTLAHNAFDAKLGPGGIVAWTTGKHVDTSAGKQFSNDHLVIYKGGKTITEFVTSKGIIEDWRFVEGGQQVATKSRGLHGPASVELFDIGARRRLHAMQAFEINDKSPAWAKPFAE